MSKLDRPPKIRSFLAIELTEGLRTKLSELLERLQKGAQFTGAHPTWVKPASVHLTLKFFGQIDEAQIASLGTLLEPVARRHSPLTVRVKGLGVFPSPRAPRVLWVGVRKAGSLHDLQEDVESTLAAAGWPEEDRDFSPHLTLARIKSLRRVGALMDVVKSHSAWDLGDWPVHEMVLFRSTLHPSGSIYTPLARFALTRPAAEPPILPPTTAAEAE
jgi:2'-5' RNA ligase